MIVGLSGYQMKSNPKYDSICATRFHGYGKDRCAGCVKEDECYQMYDPTTGDWLYPKIRLFYRHLSPVRLRIKSTSSLYEK